MIDHRDQIRIVQETVAGKEITLAHVMGGPAPIIYQKLGLNPSIDYGSSAIGIMNMTPPESAVIASDIAISIFFISFLASTTTNGSDFLHTIKSGFVPSSPQSGKKSSISCSSKKSPPF